MTKRDNPNRIDPSRDTLEKYAFLLLLVPLLAWFFLIKSSNYPLFYALVAFFGIFVACNIFIISWNTKTYHENTFLLFMGTAYLFVGGLDLLHTLGYPGTNIFRGLSANIPTQLRISARYLEGVSLLIALLFVRKKLHIHLLFLGYFLIVTILLVAIFPWQAFPDCYIEGTGFTAFKKTSEYLLCLVLAGVAALLTKKRSAFDGTVFIMLISSIFANLLSELTFVQDKDIYDSANMAGPLLKLASLYLMYRAFIKAGIETPFTLLADDLRQSRTALQTNEKRYQALVEDRTVLVCRFTPDRTLTFVNDAVTDFFGKAAKDLIGTNLHDLLNEEERREFEQHFTAFTPDAPVTLFEQCISLTNGKTRWLQCSVTTIFDDCGRVLEFQAVASDISRAKNMEVTCRRQSATLQERLKELHCLHEIAKIRERNKRSLDTMLQEITDIIPPALRHPGIARVRIIVDGREYRSKNFETGPRLLSQDILVHGSRTGALEVYYVADKHHGEEEPFLKEEKNLIDTIAERLGRVIEHKRMEESEHHTHDFLQKIIDGMTESVLLIGTDYKVKMANRIARELYRDHMPLSSSTCCYELTHHNDAPCSGDEHLCPMQKVIDTGEPCSVVHVHIGKNGARHAIELFASPIFDSTGTVCEIIEVGRDITKRLRLEEERKALQTQLFQQQKDQSISTLAGGIAHDFNNILTTVLGNAELLLMRLRDRDTEKEYAETIVKSARRMTGLVRQLLDYAQKGKQHRDIFSVNSLIRESLDFAYKGKASWVKIDFMPEENLWPVLADPIQIRQMLTNIFTNAFEAMEEGGGSVTAVTANIVKEEWTCSRHLRHPAGDYILISISDTGPGIPEEVQGRIFEPFFSSKFVGRGLGLAAAAGIVQNHDGCLTFESSPGRGSTFHILLPRARPTESQEIERKVSATRESAGRNILIVDDEPDVLEIQKIILGNRNLNILTASGGMEALECFEQKKDALDLVILDIQMPDISGKEVYKEMKSLKPTIKILISSGHDKDTALEGISLAEGDAFIQKPTPRKVFIEQVMELLE